MCGCLEVGYNVMKDLLKNGIEISYFVTITSEKATQQKVAGYKSFDSLAKKYNIPVYYAKKYSLKAPEDLAFFEEHKFDLLLQGGWQRLFPDTILNTLSIGAIGIHGSADFLPRGRGRSPINWSLIENKTRFIIHFFLIKPGIDDGDIFHYETFDILPWDTCKTLYYKNSLTTINTLKKYIPKLLNNEITLIPQQGEPTYYPKRTADDGVIDWNKNLFDIYNLIRAITKPYPGAFTFLDGNKVTIWNAQPFDTRISYPEKSIGEVIDIFDGGDIVVNALGGLLLIREYESRSPIYKGAIFN